MFSLQNNYNSFLSQQYLFYSSPCFDISSLFTVISVSSEIATNDSPKSAILIYNKEIPENIDVCAVFFGDKALGRGDKT